ncbi:hypothetical protein FRC17_002606 [Serendipita sp. 399]|nr:hypothetical protein FRC17_002606 [Serendipita sp. 399]
MRFSNIITYLTLVSVTAVFALPVHHTQHETSSGTTSISAVAPRDGQSNSEAKVVPVPSVPLSEDVKAKGPELGKRNLKTGNLSKEDHAAEKAYHLKEQETQQQLDKTHVTAAEQARAKLDAEKAKSNPNQQLVAQHEKDVKYNVAKSMEASERAKAHGAGAEYHGAMHTVAQAMSHPNPNQHDVAAVERLKETAATAVQNHDSHHAKAEEWKGKAAKFA